MIRDPRNTIAHTYNALKWIARPRSVPSRVRVGGVSRYGTLCEPCCSQGIRSVIPLVPTVAFDPRPAHNTTHTLHVGESLPDPADEFHIARRLVFLSTRAPGPGGHIAGILRVVVNAHAVGPVLHGPFPCPQHAREFTRVVGAPDHPGIELLVTTGPLPVAYSTPSRTTTKPQPACRFLAPPSV